MKIRVLFGFSRSDTTLSDFAIRHPRKTLAIAFAIVALAAPGGLLLHLRTDGHALVPREHPEARIDAQIREQFDVHDLIVVLIRNETHEGIFNADTLCLIDDLTNRLIDAFPELPEHLISSIATEQSHRVRQGTLNFRRFLEPPPTTTEEIERLRDDLRRIEVHDGSFISFDGSAASIFVGIPDDLDRMDAYRRVCKVVSQQGQTLERIDVIGAVVAEALLGTHILEDLGIPRPLLGLPERTASTLETPQGSTLYNLRIWIAQHVGLLPIALLTMTAVFAIGFRNLPGALIPLMEVGACLAFVFGLMGWLGVPIYLTIAVMPIILTAVGVADEIHIFSAFLQELRSADANSELSAPGAYRNAVRRAMAEIGRPVVKTSVTTAIAFLSFALSSLEPVAAFGVFTAVGVIFCMLWSLTVVPAMLVLLNENWFRSAIKRSRHTISKPLCVWLARITRKGRWPIVVCAAAIAAVAPQGIARVVVQDSWIDGFAPESDFAQATNAFNKRFLGMHMLLVRVEEDRRVYSGEIGTEHLDHHIISVRAEDVDKPEAWLGYMLRVTRPDAPPVVGPPQRGAFRQASNEWQARIERVWPVDDRFKIRTERKRGSPILSLQSMDGETFHWEVAIEPFRMPQPIHRLQTLEQYLKSLSQYTVGGVIGPARLLATTNFMAKALQEGTRVIPEDPDRIDWLWRQYKRIRGEDRLHQIVDAQFSSALVSVFLKNANFVDVGNLLAEIRNHEKEHLGPHGIRLSFAGDVAVSQTMIEAIVNTQVQSLLISLAGILIVTSILGRSVRWGLLCVLPCASAVAFNFAFMGASGMPLGIATSMFAGMTLGIGVDYAIHFIERFRKARDTGADTESAAAEALQRTGPAIMIDALAVGLGFGVLTLSQVPANARLGALLALSVVVCLVMTLIVLPAILQIVSHDPIDARDDGGQT